MDKSFRMVSRQALRLFFADHGEWGEFNLHEKFMMANGATIGKLEGDLLHWPFSSLRIISIR